MVLEAKGGPRLAVGVAGGTTAAARNKETDKSATSSVLPKATGSSPYKAGAKGGDHRAGNSSGTQMRSTGTARPVAKVALPPSGSKGSLSSFKDKSGATVNKGPGSPGKSDFQGEAHRLYTAYAKNNALVKTQFAAMMAELQQKGKFKFASEEKLQSFAARQRQNAPARNAHGATAPEELRFA